MAPVPELKIHEQDETKEWAREIEPYLDKIQNASSDAEAEAQKTATFNGIKTYIKTFSTESDKIAQEPKSDVDKKKQKDVKKNLTKAVLWFLKMAKRNITRNGTEESAVPTKALSEKTVAVLKALDEQSIGGSTAVALGKIFNNLLDEQEKNKEYFEFSPAGTSTKTKFEQDFENLALTNPYAAQLLQKSVNDAIGKDTQGVIFQQKNLQDIEDKLNVETILQRKKNQPRDSFDVQKEAKLLKFIQDDLDSLHGQPENETLPIAETSRKLIEKGIHSIDEFLNLYKDLIATAKGKIEEKSRLENISLSAAEINTKAGQEASLHLRDTVSYIVNKIYTSVLNENAPQKEFDQTANELDMYTNPTQLFRYFDQRLNSLREASRRLPDTQDMDFYSFKREMHTIYNQELGREEDRPRIVPKLEKETLFHFMRDLEKLSETEITSLKYGFNFSLVTGTPAREGERVMGRISTFAQTLNSDFNDRLKTTKYYDLITVAENLIQTLMFENMSKNGHIKSRKLNEDVFSEQGTIFKTVQDFFEEQYKHIDPIWRTWAVRHAMNRINAQEFMGIMVMSYMDPPEGFIGESDVTGSNSVFKWQEHAMRWAGDNKSHDWYFKGVLFYPSAGEMEHFDHTKYKDSGYKVWTNMKKYGHLACFEENYFYDKKGNRVIVPYIATPENVTKTGGPATMQGWRTRYSMVPILSHHKLVEGTRGHEYTAKISRDRVFTDMWKSVENMGVNSIRALHGDFLSGGFLSTQKDAIGNFKLKNEAQYKDLFTFLHRRYFSEGIGTAFVQDSKGTVNDENAYWEKITAKVNEIAKKTGDKEKDADKIRAGAIANYMESILHQAESVILFQRTPTALIDIPRARDEQNGITPYMEVRDELSNFDETQWTEAYRNLVYAQLEGRKMATKQINDKYKNGEWGGNNIYGELDADGHFGEKSSINNGKGYVIDEDFIRKVVKENEIRKTKQQGKDPETEKEKIDAAVERAALLYKTIESKLKSKPKESKLEKQWRESGQGDRADRARNTWMKERIVWFADAWKNNQFGTIPFLMDKTWTWEAEGLAGENTVSRTAGSCAVTAEEVKMRRTNKTDSDKSFILIAKSVVREGEDKWKAIKKYISDQGTILGEELAEDLVTAIKLDDTRRFISLLVRDDAARNIVGDIKYWLFKGGKTSAAAESWTNEGYGLDFSASELRAMLQVMVNENTIKPDQRDKIAKEFDATWAGVIKEMGPKVGLILALLIISYFIRESYEEEVEGD